MAQAEALRARVERLAEENEAAYLAARSLIEGAEGGGGQTTDEVIGKALDTAAELPLAIAEVAYDVVLLGAETAAHAAPGGADDAAAAAILAEAASHAAAGLIAANLVSIPVTSGSRTRTGSQRRPRTPSADPSQRSRRTAQPRRFFLRNRGGPGPQLGPPRQAASAPPSRRCRRS